MFCVVCSTNVDRLVAGWKRDDKSQEGIEKKLREMEEWSKQNAELDETELRKECEKTEEELKKLVTEVVATANEITALKADIGRLTLQRVHIDVFFSYSCLCRPTWRG